MLISHSHKFVFIKTRKVGGTSLEKYILDNHFDRTKDQLTGSKVDKIPWINIHNSARGHMSWGEIHQYGKVDGYGIFTLERNPWDKCVSQYYFFRDKIGKVSKDLSFSKFLRGFGNLPIDHPRYIEAAGAIIIKWEEMNQQLPYLFDSYGIKFDLEAFKGYNLKSGIRKDEHYSHLYNDKDVEYVREAFKWEIENLKYEFEDHR
jgi:hypothetical protein